MYKKNKIKGVKMKITKDELKELNTKGSVEICMKFGNKEYWEILEVEE